MFTKKRIIWILIIVVVVALIGGIIAKKKGLIGKPEETKIATEKVLEAFTKKMEHQGSLILEIRNSFSEQTSDIDPTNILSEIIRTILIRNVDHLWQEHLLQNNG